MQALFGRVRAKTQPSSREPCSSVTSLGPYAKIYSCSNRKSAHELCGQFRGDINDAGKTSGNMFHSLIVSELS